MRFRHLDFLPFLILLLTAQQTFAQGVDVAGLRSEVHERLRLGHRPLPYSQTDEAMELIHKDPDSNDNILLFYTGRSQDADRLVNSDPRNGWNREHLWPQSRGARAFPVKSDLFHLMPTDASVNQNRGNLNFDNGGTPEGEALNTLLDDNSFEPRDEVKGDVARALFYVDLRYEGTNGEPDLSLVRGTVPTGGAILGDLCTLLEWHEADPVSDEERQRNNRTENIQGNRNFFIDEPDLAGSIFGSNCPDQSSGSVSASVSETDSKEDIGRMLKIVTWNIANLHHESGVSLRSSSFARDNEDYARLAALAERLDADIALLQEVGSPAAVSRVFPSQDYHILMSDRYKPGAEQLPVQERDIYTAMVFAKDRFPDVPKVSTLSALSIMHMGLNRDGRPGNRRTRAGISTEIQFGGAKIKILGVHLKSSCHRWSLDPVEDQNMNGGQPFKSRFDCRTLQAQRAILENWIEQQAAQEVTTIVAGDFNRTLNAEDRLGQPVDDFWLELNDGRPNGLELGKGPQDPDSVCWPDHMRRFDQHIDLFVYDTNLNDITSSIAIEKRSLGHERDPKYADKARQRLSDHCPVVMTLKE